MPKSALPSYISETANRTGTDWDNSLQRWIKRAWFAYGPRAKEWWARWREFPWLLFVQHGYGLLRWESSDGAVQTCTLPSIIGQQAFHWTGDAVYLSAVQYWTKWHLQIQWPLFIAFHYYLDDDVPVYPEHAETQRVLYIRIGARRDADKVYWFPSIFVGLTWN